MMDKVKSRQESDPLFHWKTADLYASDEAWEKEHAALQKQIGDMAAFQGKLADGGLMAALTQYVALSEGIDKNYVYAHLRFHEDMGNAKYQSYSAKADQLLTKFQTVSSFLVPEILSIPEDMLDSFIKQPEAAVYRHFLENILREKAHVLSEKEEKLLASMGEIGDAAATIFSMLNDADMVFPEIHDAYGNKTPLTKSRYLTFLKNPSRAVRKEAFETYHQTYENYKNTLAASYFASVKNDVFTARTRKYPSALSLALSDDNIPEGVYTQLCHSVRKGLPLLRQYVELRKKMLKLPDIHMYDLYTPMVANIEFDISYKDAKAAVIEGLRPLGETYASDLSRGMAEGWIDVYENKGKRGGAYAWGCSSAHPYVLMNFENNIDSLFTLAHEMGHAMHSYYTWQKQPYINSGHKIFVAEVASTVNETLLIESMLKNTSDKQMKQYLLNHYLEQFRGTFFRQTMFAEFEKTTHEMVEQDIPLTAENLSEHYMALNKAYYQGVEIDPLTAIEWARIPHFYNAFYVYQYATGFSAAIALSRQILDEGKPAVERYLRFLASGTSAYSIDLLKSAGVDMESAEPVDAALATFERLLHEMEAL